MRALLTLFDHGLSYKMFLRISEKVIDSAARSALYPKSKVRTTRMPLFKVKIPIAGFAEGSFEADTEDEAVEAALNEFAEDDWDNDIWELDFDSYGTETEATGPLAELQVTLDLGVPPENAEGPESEEDEEPEDGDLEDDA